jgi:Hpt domain.
MSSQIDPAGADGEPILDESLLGGLRAALGAATDGLVEKAAKVVKERMERIADLAADPSDDLARLAHEVGGVSAQVGLKRLASEALALERMCRAGEVDAARAAAGALGETARVSVAALSETKG